MKTLPFLTLLCSAGGALALDSEVLGTYQLEGKNPGGKGSYGGTLVIGSESDSVYKLEWKLSNGDGQSGPGLMLGRTLAAGFGGKDLGALAIYQARGDKIIAHWINAAKPGEMNEYSLTGGKKPFTGTWKIAEGGGTVTFTPGADNRLEITWDLTSGKFTGVGLRNGNELAAVSGRDGGGFGVCAFGPEGGKVVGRWANAAIPGVGTEVLTKAGSGSSPKPAASAPAPSKGGKEDLSPEVVKGIQADTGKCAELGTKFLDLLKAGKVGEAVKLMDDRVFKETSREEFAAAIRQSNGVFGKMKSYKPDRKSLDFGAEEGGIYFVLEADGEYEKASVREKLRFLRPTGKDTVILTGYTRSAKQ